MDILNIVSDLLIILVVLIPIIIGIKRGFVDMALRFGKSIIAFAAATAFAKPLGIWVKDLIHPTVHEKMLAFFEGESAELLNATSLIENVPEGIRSALTVTGFDVNQMATDAVSQGELMVEEFAKNLSVSASGALGYAIAYVGIFVLTLLLIAVLRPVLNFIVNRLPVINKFNRILGAAMGALLGLLFAWILAHLLVWVLGIMAHNNWTDTYLLSFFHTVNPLQWIFSVAIKSIAAIATT